MLAVLAAIAFGVQLILELLGTEELRYVFLFAGLLLLALAMVWNPTFSFSRRQ